MKDGNNKIPSDKGSEIKAEDPKNNNDIVTSDKSAENKVDDKKTSVKFYHKLKAWQFQYRIQR